MPSIDSDSVNSTSITIKELASASVANPPSGKQRIFIDTADRKFKRKDSSGTVTTIEAALTNPMTTAGDMIYGGAAGVATRLAIGTTGQVVTVVGGNPAWATPVLPYSDFYFFMNGKVTSGACTIQAPSINTAWIFNHYSLTAGTTADGDEVSWYIPLAPGTYTLVVYGAAAGTRAKVDWYIDGTKVVSGQDWYAGSATYTVFTTTGLTVAGLGQHTIACKVNGRNASATGWLISLTAFSLTRTGA